MTSQSQNRDNIFHERIAMLRDHGYRGFRVQKTQQLWDGVEVTAQNYRGRAISAAGETKDEAYTELIDQIDLALEY
ncbi:MAG: hypothetical protein U5K69_08290 [Balneolaceae bacterium]|nr:hypothetical protein [Balneolaceae bacterium]